MAKQIKNRREDLYIEDVPPVIPSGIVTNADYPTPTKPGVVKLNPTTYGVRVSADGQLYGSPFTLAAYNSGSGNLFVTKTTLENVILSVVQAKISADMGELYTNAEVGDTWTVILRKTADGLVFDYASTE